MASIIKVDQLQSDSGTVNVSSNLNSTGNFSISGNLTISGLNSNTGTLNVLSDLATTGNVSVNGKATINSDGRQFSVIGAGNTLYEDFKCRAWVNFNGTGTVAIRASGNVSSITDNGTGDYTVNFTTAMPDTNYTVAASANGQGSTQVAAMPMTSAFVPSAPSAGAFRVFTANYAAAVDCQYIHASVFR